VGVENRHSIGAADRDPRLGSRNDDVLVLGHDFDPVVGARRRLAGQRNTSQRLELVIEELKLEAQISPLPPVVLGGLLVIPAGSTVEFPNSDSVSHQIYSFSAAKKFQLPLYRGKRYPPVRFEQVGFVTLGCNIHDPMLAYVVVTDAPYFGRTDSKGSWSVEVPRGTYRVTVWHPRMRESAELRREMTTGDTDRTAVTVRLTKPLQPAPLESRHSWDAY